MTVHKKRLVDGTVVDYAAMPILESPEFVKSLPHARESFDQPHAYVGYDAQGRQWINGRKGAPTWEEVVTGYMIWPVQDVFGHGKSHTYGPLRHWTRFEAEAKAAKACPWLVPVADPTEKTR